MLALTSLTEWFLAVTRGRSLWQVPDGGAFTQDVSCGPSSGAESGRDSLRGRSGEQGGPESGRGSGCWWLAPGEIGSRGEAGAGVLEGLEPRPLVPAFSLHAAGPFAPGVPPVERGFVLPRLAVRYKQASVGRVSEC